MMRYAIEKKNNKERNYCNFDPDGRKQGPA
jgi:hypothetical protein